MEHHVEFSSAKRSYPFIDWIRMIAMIGIIWTYIPDFKAGKSFTSLDNVEAYLFFMDFFKFGVICFFMITGFLLAGKLSQVNAAVYFKRKLYSTLFPYLLVFALIVALFIFKTHVLHIPNSYTVVTYCRNMCFDSALWLLPIYWVSLFIVLCFKRWLNRLGTGCLFLLITAIYTFYCVYTAQAQSPMLMLLAFVFYIWLGYYIRKNNLYLYFLQMRIGFLVMICLALYVMASLESYGLYLNGFAEPMNMLRVSNQIYSIVMFVTLIRIFNQPLHSHLVNPRKETFGIYLYHLFPLILLNAIVEFLSRKGVAASSLHTYTFMGWFIIKFTGCYVLSLIIVKILIKYRLGFLHYSSRNN